MVDGDGHVAPATWCSATGRAVVEGMCGVVEDGIMPGLSATRRASRRSATSSRGSWSSAVPGRTSARRAGTRASTSTASSRREAAQLAPGESGLLALDWWNGNRSVLVDVGPDRAAGRRDAGDPAPEEIYRALIEATAFGTRMIIDAFETPASPVNEIVACGGLPERNQLLMQIYADVTGPRVQGGAARSQTPALGAAMFGAVAAGAAAGGYDTITEAPTRMASLAHVSTGPNPADRAVYDELYRRVPPPARLLRARRERRHEAAQGDARPDRRRRGPGHRVGRVSVTGSQTRIASTSRLAQAK